MDKKISTIILLILIISILIVFFFPKKIGYWSSAGCEDESGEIVECEEVRYCECFGFEWRFMVFGGTSYYCSGWPVDCSEPAENNEVLENYSQSGLDEETLIKQEILADLSERGAKITFSNVSIHRSSSTVRVGLSWGQGLCIGYEYILEKEDGNWKIDSKKETYVC